MPFDQVLAKRVRRALAAYPNTSERLMFGGVCFMLSGRMLCGVAGRDFMVRVGPDAYTAALRLPHARPMDFTGRPLRGFVYVGPSGLQSGRALSGWIARAAKYVASLPKVKQRSRRRAGRSRTPPRRRE